MPATTVHCGLAVLAVDPVLDREIRADLSAVEDGLRTTLTAADDWLLTEAATHLIEAGGKRLRPLLVLLGARFGTPSARVVTAAVSAELVHVATLYHDDVMDSARVRHGVPTANVRWNNNIAVLLGDYLLARAAALGAELGQEALRMQVLTLTRLVRGQLHETVGPRSGKDAMRHCVEVMSDKSASLLAMSGQLGALIAGAPDAVPALGRYGELLGIAFQISDDVIDIASDAVDSGKTPGTDLREGVVTVPMLHALACPGNEAARLRQLAALGPVTDPGEHAEALALLRGSPGLATARADVRRYAEQAAACLAELPDIPARAALRALCDFVIKRIG